MFIIFHLTYSTTQTLIFEFFRAHLQHWWLLESFAPDVSNIYLNILPW
jgi:hypothetical protein